jgi:hypothetical protein
LQSAAVSIRPPGCALAPSPRPVISPILSDPSRALENTSAMAKPNRLTNSLKVPKSTQIKKMIKIFTKP